MNIPTGEIVEENFSLKGVSLSQKVLTLMEESFTGYLVLTSVGRGGIEEGLVLMREGKAIGAVYEYLKFRKIVYGNIALGLLLNAGMAEHGVMDISKLSRQQAELATAFNEKMALAVEISDSDLAKIIPNEYNPAFAEKAIEKELETKESKFDVFKKFGLGGIR